MYDSTSKPIVLISSDQLQSFKSVSKKLFEIIARITESEKIAVRRGLDILSRSFGYSSHPDLVTRSRGYKARKGEDLFPVIPQANIFQIASNLSKQVDGLSYEKAKKALFLLNSSNNKISKQCILQSISELVTPSDVEYTEVINPIHQALTSENYSAFSSIIKKLNIPSLSENAKIELVMWCVRYGLNDDLKHLLKEGAPSDSSLDSRGWAPPLAIAIEYNNIDAQIILVKNGADINRDEVIGYEWSMPFLAMEYKSHKLLNYCIDEGLLNHDDGYLRFCVQVNCLNTTASILRISTEDNIVDAFWVTISQGLTYQFSFLYKLYQSTIDQMDFNKCLPDYDIKPRALAGILRCFLCYPNFISKLDINRLALRIIECMSFSYKDYKSDCDDVIQEFLLSPDSNFNHVFSPEHIVDTLLSTSDDSLRLKVIQFLNAYGISSSLQVIYETLTSDTFPFSLKIIIGKNPQTEYLNCETALSIFDRGWRIQWVKMYIDEAKSLEGCSRKEKLLDVAQHLIIKLELTEEEITKTGRIS